MPEHSYGSTVFERINRAALLAYVASIPFSNVTLVFGFSLSFVTAVAFFASKLLSLVLLRRVARVEPETITLGLVLGYLVVKEVATFGVQLDRAYFGTFALNLLMCLALVDEFKRDASIAKWSMAVFAGLMTVISILIPLGLGAQFGDAGRATFLGINENELALSFLVAFTFIALRLSDWRVLSKPTVVLYYGGTVALILALVGTGTRFTLIVLVFQLLLLLVFHVFHTVRQKQQWPSIVLVASWLLLVLAATAASKTMAVRLDPTVGAGRSDSSGVMELGGRMGLWQTASEAFLQSPLFGLGREGFVRFQLQEAGHHSLPHNLGMEMAAVGGLVGVAMIAVLGLQLARRVQIGVMQGMPTIVLTVIPLIAGAAFLNVLSIKVVWFLLAYVLAIQSSVPHTSQATAPTRFLAWRPKADRA